MNGFKRKSELHLVKSIMKTTVRIGKKGLTIGIINEIKSQLKSKGVVKISLLKNFFNTEDNKNKKDFNIKEVAKKIAKYSNAEVFKVIGRKIILYDPNAKKYRPILKENKIEKENKKQRIKKQ